jgi:hypothetical protein
MNIRQIKKRREIKFYMGVKKSAEMRSKLIKKQQSMKNDLPLNEKMLEKINLAKTHRSQKHNRITNKVQG